MNVQQAEFKPLLEELQDNGEHRKVLQMFQNTSEPLLELARDLVLQKELAQSLKDQLEEINKEIATKEQNLYDLMLENVVDGLKINGKSLSPQLVKWANIPADNQNAGFMELRRMGLESFIRETVNSQTLSAEVRRQVEEGNLEKKNDMWVWKNGPLAGHASAIKISEVKKIGVRKA